MVRRCVVLAGIVCAAVTGVSLNTVRAQSNSCFASTMSGDVQGLNAGSSCAFLGIPFAAPPTGGLRWKRPQPAPPWATAINATAAPPACPQLNNATGLPQGLAFESDVQVAVGTGVRDVHLQAEGARRRQQLFGKRLGNSTCRVDEQSNDCRRRDKLVY